MEFLRIKITEAMEKYPMFEGLTNLRAYNLLKEPNKLQLADVRYIQRGEIGSQLKSGDNIVCELTSHDIWIEIKASCSDINMLISFEIKALKALKYKDFKEVVHNYLKSMVRSKNIDSTQMVSLRFKKLKSIHKRINLSSSSSNTFADIMTTYEIEEPRDLSLLGDYFDYNRKSIYYDVNLECYEEVPTNFGLSDGSDILTEAASEDFDVCRFFGHSLPIRDLTYNELEVDLERISQIIHNSKDQDSLCKSSCWSKINKNCMVI